MLRYAISALVIATWLLGMVLASLVLREHIVQGGPQWPEKKLTIRLTKI